MTIQRYLTPHRRECRTCDHPLWMLYQTSQTVAPVEGRRHLILATVWPVQVIAGLERMDGPA